MYTPSLKTSLLISATLAMQLGSSVATEDGQMKLDAHIKFGPKSSTGQDLYLAMESAESDKLVLSPERNSKSAFKAIQTLPSWSYVVEEITEDGVSIGGPRRIAPELSQDDRSSVKLAPVGDIVSNPDSTKLFAQRNPETGIIAFALGSQDNPYHLCGDAETLRVFQCTEFDRNSVFQIGPVQKGTVAEVVKTVANRAELNGSTGGDSETDRVDASTEIVGSSTDLDATFSSTDLADDKVSSQNIRAIVRLYQASKELYDATMSAHLDKVYNEKYDPNKDGKMTPDDAIQYLYDVLDVKQQHKQLAIAKAAYKIAGNDGDEYVDKSEMEQFLYKLFTDNLGAQNQYETKSELGININLSTYGQ